MALNLLALVNSKRTDKIGLSIIFKHDILPWLVSAGFALLLFAGIQFVIGSANSSVSSEDVLAIMYSRAQVVYMGVLALAVLLARRSKGIWTWILTVILIIFFLPNSNTIASSLMPNSILQALVAMIGFLAAERIVEYIRLHYIMDLETPVLIPGAITAYILLVAGAIFMVTPLFAGLL